MQPTQKLANAFRNLLSLVEEEATRNPAFAERLEEVSASLPATSVRRSTTKKAAALTEAPPDIFAVYQDKGEDEFRFWLRSLDIRLLKAVVKANGFDPGKVAQRWTEPDKFIELISEQTAARLRRGSAFLTPKPPRQRRPEDV